MHPDLLKKQVGFFKKLTRFSLFLLVFLTSSMLAEDSWSVNSSIQMSSGKYIYDETVTTYILNLGLRYRSESWGFFATLPLLAQNTNSVIYSGNMFIPAGHSNNEQIQGNSHHGNMAGGSMSASSMSLGLGDLYIYADYTLINDREIIPEISVTGQIKAPTANTGLNFGTGEFDFGAGITLRKMISRYFIFSDLSYLKLGDPDEVNFINPIAWGVGVGRYFGNHEYSASIYYFNYSKIFSEFETQRQITIALYHRLNTEQIISLRISRGLSETSPDINIAVGMEITI